VSAPRSAQEAGLRLARAIRADDALLGSAVPEPGTETHEHGPGLVQAAVAGPRAAGRADEYELALEAIREGYRLHFGAGEVVRAQDPDLALLGGDRLYAMGLAKLAELGDLSAIGELADVISLSAQAHAEGDPARAEAAWEAGVAAVGHGSPDGHPEAKALARAGAPGAAAALREAAARRGAPPGPAVD